MEKTSSKDIGPNQLYENTSKGISVVSYIRDADTWIAKVQQKYVKKMRNNLNLIFIFS